MYLTPYLSLKIPEYGDDNILSPTWMSYYDYTFGTIDTLLYNATTHLTSNGTSHSYLGQNVSPTASPSFSGLFLTPTTGFGYPSPVFYAYSDTSWQGIFFTTRRARGTKESPAATANLDTIGAYDFFAYDGSTFRRATQISSFLDGTVASGITPGQLWFQTTDASGISAVRLKIRANGNIENNSYYQSSVLLGGATTLSVDASGKIIRTPSDARLKSDIRDIELAEEQLMGIRPVSYEWNDKSEMGAGKSCHGFIAQEIIDVVPEAVSGSYGAGYSVDNGPIVALLVKQVQELTKRVHELENERIKKS